jgi:hypothetical protein
VTNRFAYDALNRQTLAVEADGATDLGRYGGPWTRSTYYADGKVREQVQQVQLIAGPSGSEVEVARTRYVYDDLRRLRVMIENQGVVVDSFAMERSGAPLPPMTRPTMSAARSIRAT